MCSVTISERDLFALFATESATVEFFESIRWPQGPVCPSCHSQDVVPKSGHPFFSEVMDREAPLDHSIGSLFLTC